MISFFVVFWTRRKHFVADNERIHCLSIGAVPAVFVLFFLCQFELISAETVLARNCCLAAAEIKSVDDTFKCKIAL